MSSFAFVRGLYVEKNRRREGDLFLFFFFPLWLQSQAQKYPTAKAGHMEKLVLHIYIELPLFCFVCGYCYWASLGLDGHIKGAALA